MFSGINTHVENDVCNNVIYHTVSAISVSIPPVRHVLVTTIELKYLNCRHSNVRIGGIGDNNVTFYMGSNHEQLYFKIEFSNELNLV